MPIILDQSTFDQSQQAAVKTFTPKFFDSKLTGRGGSIGILSNKNNPAAIPINRRTSISDCRLNKKSYRSGATTVTNIPVNPLIFEAWNHVKTMDRHDLTDMVKIGEKGNLELYLCMSINTMCIEETLIQPDYQTGGSPTKETIFKTNYQLFFYIVADKNKVQHQTTNTFATNQKPENRVVICYSTNPVMDYTNEYKAKILNENWKLDDNAVLQYFTNYSLYDTVAKRSEEWQTTIDKTLDMFFANITGNKANWDPDNRTLVEAEIRHLMDYNIPLDIYRNIYRSIMTYFPADDARMICKQNLNLLLSDTLNDLNNSKATIPSFTPPTPAVQMPPSVARLSTEQLAAVSSTEPLILVQAGAGTGKSTLILGRIDYLTACGVNPNDITVLSFTNAAADHITEKNTMVHSMTIARMIHEIYTTNFKDHDLSSIDTIINALDIYYPQMPGTKNTIVADFQRHLKAMQKNDANNVTNMNNFIEEHYDEVISILDTIHQTSLELEIIICYQKIDTFIEPPTVTSKFLIIDEVQDNSVFEFIYMLKYINKHKESLFIVGDCSQTLYEFRASNPRALNILEGSQTFATYQLNVNYRSNQEILDFANIALQNIEANQYAKIQLQANNLAKVTEQTFLDRVHFNYHRLSKISDFHQALPDMFAIELEDYIKSCLARGEKVAFLSFTRQDIKAIKDVLEKQFPKRNIASLVPTKMYNSTVMSEFIKRYWNDMKFMPPGNIISIIISEIMSRLDYLVYNPSKARNRVFQMLTDWATASTPHINAWTNQVLNGTMTSANFANLIKEDMMQFEIKNNAARQMMLSVQNQQQKTTENIDNADFLLSTIHSAKGLEFDNVVVFYRNDNALDEERKRMYYVAFTRAMKSEYVMAYDTVVSPQIQADYMTVLERLHDIAPSPNSPIPQLLNAKKKATRIQI